MILSRRNLAPLVNNQNIMIVFPCGNFKIMPKIFYLEIQNFPYLSIVLKTKTCVKDYFQNL